MMNDGYGWGMDWGMPFFGLFFWLLIVAGVVFLVRWIIGHKADDIQTRPLDILKQRYARGEIDRETYERMKKDLKS
ncbi:hypothetical protein MNBD_GAMMA24-853 [hydrothermal vent metagenome]|uniref:SHOCT domain-containing protein n=1 Tax=hydrothermal vent metagenome TaxID=652676 RepID=A0A3B1C6Z0_9ZZZZ